MVPDWGGFGQVRGGSSWIELVWDRLQRIEPDCTDLEPIVPDWGGFYPAGGIRSHCERCMAPVTAIPNSLRAIKKQTVI